MAQVIISFLRRKKLHGGRAVVSFPVGVALSVLAALGHLSQRERQGKGALRTVQLCYTNAAASVSQPIGTGDSPYRGFFLASLAPGTPFPFTKKGPA